MVLLDKGRFPKVFGWRQACDAYIEHIRACKRNMVKFDLDKAEARLNVVEGLLIAVANIDEVVAIIRASESPSAAASALIERFKFNKPQVEAILAMKLSALTRIDGIKLNTEKEELNRFIADQRHLLSSPQDLDKKLIEILNIVSQKFGDGRRTQIMDILGDEEEPEQIVEKDIAVCAYGNSRYGYTIKLVEMPIKGKGLKKPDQIFYTTNLGSLIVITDAGKYYTASLSKLKMDKEYKLNEIFELEGEHPRLLIDTFTFNAHKSLTCVTRNGMIKKSHPSEYASRAKKGSAAIKLDNDLLIAAILSSDDDDKIAVIANNNYYNCYPLSEISYTGRVTKGVKAIKLEKDGYVKEAKWVGDNTYKVTGRAVKGVKNG
jgi:DNA gyrase subunit A